ncbi:5-formyltetrahydrofolate cyclo-ligase-like [Onthophagus taurus]|uniref:5-formyltetrahydrofolate cyclo-ligase-like n=1 Tax=Onthophagus taurus TaxID=166361 RepID=UPI0039BE2725
MTSVQAAKKALRKSVEEKILKILPEDKRRQSSKVCEKLFEHPAFKNSERISVYLSTDNEIDTEPIVRKIFELNKKCYVPRYNKNVMEMVRLKDMEDWKNLPLTKWNIKQPDLKETRENALETGGLDLIILPGVAFTKKGVRLGHGKGYYDKFQSELFKIQSKRPSTIALAFKEQILDEIPTHEHDVTLDLILFE